MYQNWVSARGGQHAASVRLWRAQVVVWSGVSFAVGDGTGAVPRRLPIPDTWRDAAPYSTARVRPLPKHRRPPRLPPLKRCCLGLMRAQEACALPCLVISRARCARAPRERCVVSQQSVCVLSQVLCGTAITLLRHAPCKLAACSRPPRRRGRGRAGARARQALGDVPGAFVGAAAVPALVIAVLFYFDHNVSAQMAQQPEFNLGRPPAYGYDMLLLGAYTLACGLLGIPPVNGVLPQARAPRAPARVRLTPLPRQHDALCRNWQSEPSACAMARLAASGCVAAFGIQLCRSCAAPPTRHLSACYCHVCRTPTGRQR